MMTTLKPLSPTSYTISWDTTIGTISTMLPVICKS